MHKRRLYLASASPRRAQILSEHKIPFTLIENALVDETVTGSYKHLRNHIRYLAKKKAVLSQKNYRGLILSSDTAVVLNNTILGKPKDQKEAMQMLSNLSGRTHRVITGFCIIDSIENKTRCATDVSFVTFKTLSTESIESYCKHFNVLDKAGAYAIQDIGNQFVKTFTGSYYNIVGLPIEHLLTILKNYDIVDG